MTINEIESIISKIKIVDEATYKTSVYFLRNECRLYPDIIWFHTTDKELWLHWRKGEAPNKRELDIYIEGNSITFVSENNLTPKPIKKYTRRSFRKAMNYLIKGTKK